MRSLRFKLPIYMGALSAALMIWDIQNQHVIQTMGEAWDTGAPRWHYQTPNTLFNALNAPSLVFGRPLANLFGLLRPADYLALFPCALLWWLCVGIFFDHRDMKRQTRQTKWKLRLASMGALLFASIAGWAVYDTVRWWLIYRPELLSSSVLILVRDLAPAVWSLALSAACISAAIAISRKRTAPGIV
jgi:hypothetical protein